MKVTRAFVGSVGAGLCLVAAAVTLLFVLSAVVAVRGWPGIDPEDDVQRVTLADGGLASSGGATGGPPLAVAASAGGTTPIVLGAPAPGGDRAVRTGSDGARTRDALRGGRPSAGTPAPGAGSTTAQQGAANSSSPARPTGPTGSGNAVADTIRQTGDQVGDTADSVAPGSGSAVTQVTDRVAGTVEDAGDAAGVPQVTDRPAETVRDTGSAVENVTQGEAEGTVQKTTDAVGGLLGGK